MKLLKMKSVLPNHYSKNYHGGFISSFLLIPLSYVQSLIEERADRKKDVVQEVTKSWGTDVHIYGPILRIPYLVYDQTTLLKSSNQ